MQIKTEKLKEILALVKPVVPKKATLKVLRYIRLGGGRVMATDLETMVIADLPEATDPMLVPFAAVDEAIKYIPSSDILTLEVKDGKVYISGEAVKASYPTKDVLDFPVLPDMQFSADGDLNGDALIAAMKSVLPYASTEEARPVLAGVALVLGTPITVAAGDGYRMALQVLPSSFPEDTDIIIPAHAAAVLAHIFEKTPRPPVMPVVAAKRLIRLSLMSPQEEGRRAQIDFGKAKVVVKLISGRPPSYISLIPKGEPVGQAKVFAPALEAAVKRVRGIASDTTRLTFDQGKLTICARAADEEISVALDTEDARGEPWRFGINHAYLLTYVSGKQGFITISQHSADTGPLLFQYQNITRVLIMPMHVDWDGNRPKEPTAPGPETPSSEEATEESPGTEETEPAEPAETEPEGGEDVSPAKPKRSRRKKVPAN